MIISLNVLFVVAWRHDVNFHELFFFFLHLSCLEFLISMTTTQSTISSFPLDGQFKKPLVTHFEILDGKICRFDFPYFQIYHDCVTHAA